VAQQFEVRVIEQVLDVVLGAGEEVVDTEDVVAGLEQAVAQVRAEEPRPPVTRMRLRVL
jgi:hypothetical protein